MKPSKYLNIFRATLAALLIAVTPLAVNSMGCGGSGENPPVFLPAPTGSYMNSTAPNQNGFVLIYGYLYASGSPLPSTEVVATNETSQASTRGTSNTEAYFEVTIAAGTGDQIGIAYVDPATGETSETTTITISQEAQQMTATNLLQKAEAVGYGGHAFIVANDGTNSQLININLSTGEIKSRTNFSNVKFDKIATYTNATVNFAAILDTSTNTFSWYDLDNLSDDVAPVTSKVFTVNVHDVAVVQLDTTPFTTDSFIVISHDILGATNAIFTIYPISVADLTLGNPSSLCIMHSRDTGYYPTTCGVGAPNYVPQKGLQVSLVKTSDNYGRLAIVGDYTFNSQTYLELHFLYFTEAAGAFTINVTGGQPAATYPRAGELDWDTVPTALAWYDGSNTLLLDSTLKELTKSYVSGTAITGIELGSVGTTPVAIYPDSAGQRAFVADSGANKILTIDMTNFTVGATSYDANYTPSGVIYYADTLMKRLGIMLTQPIQIFKTTIISE